MRPPGKELLSEVLGREVKSGKGRIIYDENTVSFAYKDEDLWSDINIHEFAYKCKEWAYNEHDILILSSVSEIGTSSIRDSNGVIEYVDTATTEPEAIFKACEWILIQEKENV